MKKKLILDFDFSSGFTLIGVSCPKKDYWLAFQLNKSLAFNFLRGNDLINYNAKLNKELAYSFFEYLDENSNVKYFLISNFNMESKLVPMLNSIDYFIVIKNETTNLDIGSIVSAIRKIKGVLLVNLIETSKIKKFKSILLDLEMMQ